jgi:hypothetical protein
VAQLTENSSRRIINNLILDHIGQETEKLGPKILEKKGPRRALEGVVISTG